MAESNAYPAVVAAVRSSGTNEPLDWNRLMAAQRPEQALAAAAALAPGIDYEIVLESSADPSAPTGCVVCPVAGSPAWRVVVGSKAGAAQPSDWIHRLAEAMAAWRGAMAAGEGARSRLEAQARELHLIQDLGRRAAEAADTEDLFACVAEGLSGALHLDAVVSLLTEGEQGEVTADVRASRPFAGTELEALVLQASAEWPDVTIARIVQGRLLDYDASARERSVESGPEPVRLPLVRRSETIGYLAVFPSAPLTAAQQRLLLGASNQLSLHLDRILTLKQAEQGRFRAILDSMPQAVFLTDGDLRVVQSNRAAAELLSRFSGETPGRPLERIGALNLGPLARRVLDDGEPVSEAAARTEDGTHWTVTLSPFGHAGSQQGLVVVLTDVTERRRIEEQLHQSEKMSSLGQMISGIVHELNNPLASILGYAQLVGASPALDPKLAGRVETLVSESERCQKIVRNLLLFVRNQQAERSMVSLNEVARSVRSLLQYSFRVKGVSIELELDADLPGTFADRHQLQQVLVNLLTNAQHAILGQADRGTVLLRTRVVDGRVCIEVDDDGPGVPEELRQRIFDPFYTTKEAGMGTGLGLSLVFSMIAAHQGRIFVLPSERGGARFSVELPVTAEAEEGLPIEQAADEPRAATIAAAERVLVIDDEETIAAMIAEALREDGYRVETVHDGAEALEKVDREQFGLIIADYRMPSVQGRQLYDVLCERRPGPVRGLLLTTGDTMSDEPFETARSNGVSILNKPFNLEDLRRNVRRELRGAARRNP